LATIDTVVRIAGDLGATPVQVALRWLIDRPGVTAPIVGARTVQQITDAWGAVNLALDGPESQREKSDHLSAAPHGRSPFSGVPM